MAVRVTTVHGAEVVPCLAYSWGGAGAQRDLGFNGLSVPDSQVVDTSTPQAALKMMLAHTGLVPGHGHKEVPGAGLSY